ncbi:hypothetical protein [Streptosporangium saharense]|uniref:hypothetical protein n=1 Tax=Streptosporangium saharense TaxID=1706840 RepID=UPI003438327E
MYVYRNSSTGQVVELAERSVRLDHLNVWLLIAEPEPEQAPEGEPASEAGPRHAPRRPSENGGKAVWVSYALTRGMTEADAKSLSKAALIEEFGRDDEEEP